MEMEPTLRREGPGEHKQCEDVQEGSQQEHSQKQNQLVLQCWRQPLQMQLRSCMHLGVLS